MRVAIITESFPPDVNGVSNSVVRVAEHLRARGHEPLVVAPMPATGRRATAGPMPYPVLRVPSVPMPGYPNFRLGLPSRRIAAALTAHDTELVHLASPFVLGSGERAAWRWLRHVHNSAERTLAPSTAAATTLLSKGIQRVWLWRRGVDAARFNPGHRSEALRRALAPGGEVLVGYVGRLAAEKRVDLLAPVARQRGVRLVVVGSGPAEPAIRRALPDAVFLGERHGSQLGRIYASLDVFSHAGPFETFGQTVQEALASGLPVVAPAAGGPLDLVDPGRTGFLVPPGDADALAEAVATLVVNPALRLAFGRAARAEVAGRTWTAVGDELIEHYVAVHSGGMPAPRLNVPA